MSGISVQGSYNAFPSTGKREITSFSESKNRSYLQPYSSNSVFQGDELKEALTSLLTISSGDSKKEIQIQWIESNSDLIKSHVDRRIQLFFKQAILCYNTSFNFEAKAAEDQIGSGRTVKFKDHTFRTQAAHSSTLPCLCAQLRNEDGSIDSSESGVFLRHSQTYTYDNSTVDLPDCVNKTDTYIDGKKEQKGRLRTEALDLINNVASGILNPNKATIEFLKRFKEVLEASLISLALDDLRYYVIKRFYLPKVNHALAQFGDCPELFDQILGVRLNAQNKESILREIVYRERFKIIQRAQEIESLVAKRILDAQNKIFPKRQKKTLNTVDKDLRFAILSQSRSSLQRRLSKLFCTSMDQLLTSFDNKNRSKKVKNSESFFEKHKKEISVLMRDIRAYFRELEKLELTYRSQLFSRLRRNFKNWTQNDLVKAFKKQFPSDPMSQSTVSRLESGSRSPHSINYKTPANQRQKEVDISIATKMAQIFGVDPGLFLAGLITSDELS